MIIALFRTAILYVLIIVGIRLMGKRQVGELEPSEFVLTLLIADLAAVPMQDYGIPLLSGVIPIMTLLCITMMISILTMKSIRFRAIMCGQPSIVVQDGKLKEAEMRKNRFTLDELTEELRIQGVTDIASVKYAILETNGMMSVILKASDRPATTGNLGVVPAETGLPMILVNDGRLMTQNMRARGLDDIWLKKQLDARGIGHVQEVFLLTVDEQNGVFCMKKEKAK